MKQKTAHLLLVVFAVLAAGCGPRIDRHRYIQIVPVDGLTVVEQGQAELKGLFADGELPMRYRLQRGQYTLELSVPADSYLPSLHIELLPGDAAGLKPRRDAALAGPSGAACASYYISAATPGVLQFGWSPECDSPSMPRQVSFDLLAPDGSVLAQENLAFELRPNGWFFSVDAV